MGKKQRHPRPKPVPIHSAAKRAAVYRRWRRWWKMLLTDITTIALHRYVYQEVTAMIDAKPALRVPSAFYDWMRLAYVTDMTAAIRRLVDWDRRSISLVRLIEEIADHPEVISRRRFVSLYRGALPRRLAQGDFERFARPGAETIDPRVIQRHRRDLLAAHRRLRMFVNKHVAHRARHPMRHLPVYSDLDKCVDVLEQLAKEYSRLLEAVALARVVPVIQYDWQKPFRMPWL
jgi:AbiU2